MWLLWSALVALPFEQSGKFTCSSRFVGALQLGSPGVTPVVRRSGP